MAFKFMQKTMFVFNCAGMFTFCFEVGLVRDFNPRYVTISIKTKQKKK